MKEKSLVLLNVLCSFLAYVFVPYVVLKDIGVHEPFGAILVFWMCHAYVKARRENGKA